MNKNTLKKRLKEVEAWLPGAINHYPVPGLAVGIVHRGEMLFENCYGYADLQKEKPVSPDTIFRIMSISKTFTSIGILQLWEQGKFDLDDPVNPYLNGLKVQHPDLNAPQITIRHLLTHTSGVGETRGYSDLLRPVGGLAAKKDTRILSMREYYQGKLQAETYPGMKWAYANHAFAILAQLIEDVSGLPFAEYMRKNVFDPLGMQRSEYFLSEKLREDLAQGYALKGAQFKDVEYVRLNTPGCGGIFSSLAEMRLYVAALMNGGENEHGRVLKPETLKLMMTSQIPSVIDERIFKMGLGFFLEDIGSHLVAEHGGGWPGFISSMRVVPDEDLAVLVFTNSSSLAPGIIAGDILHMLLDVPNPRLKERDQSIPENFEDWPQLCGDYAPLPGFLTNARFIEGMGGETRVFVKDGKLMMCGLFGPGAKPFPLFRKDAADPLLYEGVTENSVLTVLFSLDDEGRINRLSMSGVNATLYKRPFKQSWRFLASAGAGALAGGLLLGAVKALSKKK